MDKETLIISKNWTALDGSLILINPEASFVDAQVAHYVLSKSAKKCLQLLCNANSYCDKQGLVSIKHLASVSNESIHSFRNKLRVLRSKGILQSIPFVYEDGTKHPRVTLETIHLLSAQEFFGVEPLSGSSEPYNVLSTATSSSSELVTLPTTISKTALNADLLRQSGFKPPQPNPNVLVVRQTGNNVTEQLTSHLNRKKGRSAIKNKKPDEEQGREIFVKSTNGTIKVPVRVRSLLNIMDSEDLQVLFAIYALVYNYHVKSLPEHRALGTVPLNKTPIHISQIIYLLGRSRGGPNQAYVRDCLKAIDDTVYDFSSLAEIEFDDHSLHGYARRTWKNFKYFSPLTASAPTLDEKTQKVNFRDDDATIYIVSLPDHIFNGLMENDVLFAYPKNSLSVPSVIFSLYLRYRALCRADKPVEEGLKNLTKGLYGDSSLVNKFKDMLRSAYVSLSRKKIDDKHLELKYINNGDDIQFNFWGYHGILALKDDHMAVTCDHEEMLHCCSPDSEIDSNSPIIQNEISELFVNDINSKISRQLARTIYRRFKKFTVSYGDDVLHKYSSLDYIYSLAEQLANNHQLNSLSVEMLLKHDIEKIDGLTISSKTLSNSKFTHFLSRFNIDVDDPCVVNLISSLNRRTHLHDDLSRVVFEYEKPTKKIVDVIHEIIDQS